MQERSDPRSNTYEEMKDKSRLSKSRKISLYLLVSDLLYTLFPSEMKNGKTNKHQIMYLCYMEILKRDPQTQTIQKCIF